MRTGISIDFDPIAYINTPRWNQARLGLDRIRELLNRLGNPQKCMHFVHVAGTNGKGSTSCYIASVLQEAGFKTGLFTSPFIEKFEERIQVNKTLISAEDLYRTVKVVKKQAECMASRVQNHPTEFELMTAVALKYFAQCGCEIVVVEVGLGGRLDSTNIIDAPDVAVITRIGLDHTSVLGNTISAIAREKAGIIKPGSAVVSWPQAPSAMEVIRDVAKDCGNTLVVPDFSSLEVLPVFWDEKSMFCGGVRKFVYKQKHYSTRLLGSYQPANAALVIEAVEALRLCGWDIADSSVQMGIAKAQWPGRFEVVARTQTRPAFVIDGGHNPQGTRALIDSLNDVFPCQKPVFVMGVLADKDYESMIESALELSDTFVTLTPPNPRALLAKDLARAIRKVAKDMPTPSNDPKVFEADSFDDAFQLACNLSATKDIVCAFGSLYSVSSLKAALAKLP